MHVSNYYRLYNTGIVLTNTKIKALAGRMLHGITPEDFETLSDDPNRKIVFYIKEEGLIYILGKTVKEILVGFGYELSYLLNIIDQGKSFKLIIFTEPKEEILATWDNLLAMIVNIYPKTSFLVNKYIDLLKTTEFETIEKQSTYSFKEVIEIGITDPRFITYERLDFENASLSEFRAFLYFTVYIREYYSGNGYTKIKNCDTLIKEYITPNIYLDEIENYRIIDLEL